MKGNLPKVKTERKTIWNEKFIPLHFVPIYIFISMKENKKLISLVLQISIKNGRNYIPSS